MPDNSHLVEFEQLHNSTNRCDVLLDGQRRLAFESARARARKVDDVTGHVIAEVGQELPERRSRNWPPMDEEDVRTLADSTVGDFAGADIEERIRFTAKDFGGFDSGK